MAEYIPGQQLHFCLGIKTYGRSHPHVHVLDVIDALLGGCMSSPLFRKLREEVLAYDSYSWSRAFRSSGFLKLYGTMTPQKATTAVESIIRMLGVLRNGSLTEQEIAFAKDYCRGSLGMQLDDNLELSFWLGQLVLLTETVVSPERAIDVLDTVTAREVQDVARELFVPGNIVLSVACLSRAELVDRIRTVFLEETTRLLQDGTNRRMGT